MSAPSSQCSSTSSVTPNAWALLPFVVFVLFYAGLSIVARSFDTVPMAVAFSVSLACIRFLMNYVKRHDFRVFGWYRIALGALVLLWFLVIK